MGKESIELIQKVVNASNQYERMNNDLKREYIVSNIMLYNAIASSIQECMGTFGTGYPFYVLNKDLTGALPVIDEQFRYNNELAQAALNSDLKEWVCAECISVNGCKMPDLKRLCKPCPWIEEALKPRKVINRLPDIDKFFVCKEEDIDLARYNLGKKLAEHGFETSDVDPVKTIYDLSDIVESLQRGQMPSKKLPIDTHIVDYVTLYTLIGRIPDVLDHCFKNDQVPYLPVHPWSLRKDWQKDDAAYNFILDFMLSYTEFNMDPKIQAMTDEVRREIVKKYPFEQLQKWVLEMGPDSVARRFKTPKLQETFKTRMDSWREL